MANECYIKNSKNYSPKQVLDLISQELSKKFNLACQTSYEDSKEGYIYLEVKVKELIIPFFLNDDNNFAFYDTPRTSFTKGNYELDNSYAKNFHTYVAMVDFYSVYAYLHQYLMHFLAHHFQVEMDSDGAGPIQPFSHPTKYQSYQSWFNYWSTYHKNQPLILKKLLPSLKKIKSQELAYFPEFHF